MQYNIKLTYIVYSKSIKKRRIWFFLDGLDLLFTEKVIKYLLIALTKYIYLFFIKNSRYENGNLGLNLNNNLMSYRISNCKNIFFDKDKRTSSKCCPKITFSGFMKCSWKNSPNASKLSIPLQRFSFFGERNWLFSIWWTFRR